MREQGLHRALVHRGRRGEHAGADVGKPGHLEEPLDGAVLAEGAVQHGEDDVDARQPAGQVAGRVHVELAPGGVGGQHETVAGGVDLGQDAVGDP